MGRINVREVSDAAPELLFDVARNVERYSELVPALGDLNILESSGDGRFVKAEWTFFIRALRITRDVAWIQDTHWDPDELKCTFSLSPEYCGNLEKMEGVWLFRPEERGAEMSVDIDVKIKDNVLPPRLAGLADMAVRRLNEEILRAVKVKAETGALRPAVG